MSRRVAPVPLLCVTLLLAGIARADVPSHPELPSTSTEQAKPSPLVTVGGRQFYGYGADLLEWSGEAIVARTRLPARIVQVAARDDKTLTVTLGPKSEFGFVRETVPIAFPLDGPRPGRGFWSGGSFDAYLSLREARAVALGQDLEQPLEAGLREKILAALVAREKLDRVNPLLPLFRGQVLARAGKRDEALVAFDQAADLPGAAFNDLLRAATLLEEEGAKAAADRAFDRGLSAMRAAGLRPERLQSQMAHQVLLGVPRRALFEALQLGDVERVDRIEERVFRLCPRVEGANVVWRDLAAWLRAQGKADLATKWSARADDAARSVTNATSSRTLERLLPSIAGMAMVAPLTALLVGLRRSFKAASLFTLVVPLLATVLLLSWAHAELQTLARRSLAPVALLDDGVASPDVARFVEQKVVPGPERTALLAWIDRESQAIREGRREEGPPPDDAVTIAALARPDVGSALRDALAQKGGPAGRVLGFSTTLLAAALAFVVGWLVGKPAAARAASRVVPGGPSGLGPLGPLLGGAFLGALFSFAELGRAFSTAANHARFFGLEAIANDTVAPAAHGWAIAIVLAYVVVHVFAVRADKP